MDITKMTLVELKALAYDEMAKIEMAKMNIAAINEQMAKVQETEKKAK